MLFEAGDELEALVALRLAGEFDRSALVVGRGTEYRRLGAPFGAGLFTGGLDVLSLGLDGEIVLEFVDNVIFDGGGVDFTVFENAFLELDLALMTEPPFSEPAATLRSSGWVTTTT